MSYWASRGLRGSAFEEVLNMTNEQYRNEGLALIQKIPMIRFVRKCNILIQKMPKKAFYLKPSTICWNKYCR